MSARGTLRFQLEVGFLARRAVRSYLSYLRTDPDLGVISDEHKGLLSSYFVVSIEGPYQELEDIKAKIERVAS